MVKIEISDRGWVPGRKNRENGLMSFGIRAVMRHANESSLSQAPEVGKIRKVPICGKNPGWSRFKNYEKNVASLGFAPIAIRRHRCRSRGDFPISLLDRK